jgi:hypothetical protein
LTLPETLLILTLPTRSTRQQKPLAENLITYRGRNFHSVWDANPTCPDDTPTPKLLEMANAVAPDRGSIEN